MSVSAVEAVARAGLDTGDLDLANVTIRPMPVWMSGVSGHSIAALTLGSVIFVSNDRFGPVIDGEDKVLLLHELVHVNQWQREGKVGFLIRYLGDYFRNRLIGLDHRVAYRAIGFEAAAYDTSDNPDRKLA